MSSGHNRYETINLTRIAAVARGRAGGVAAASRLDSLAKSSADVLIMPWCLFGPAGYMYHSEPPQKIQVVRKEAS
ncbi:MAG: hypothetical protein ACKVOI_13860 [Dongiaceae bacterium]